MEGFNIHRHKANPKEEELHDKFEKEFIQPKYSSLAIDRLVFGHSNNGDTPKDFLSLREMRIVLSTIQWLGSPVGQGFLRDCGFKLENK